MAGPENHVRIARPSRDLAAARRFYVDGLGLSVLYSAAAGGPGEHDVLMVGWPGGTWHFELTRDPAGHGGPAPTADDLFVLYLGGPVPEDLVEALLAAGGERVPSSYWDKCGVTVMDPDGYRLVLCQRTWDRSKS
ncbi:VOC family protein [Longispora albida]|uniref:VOC family protein n=1 Tax=Longispora albida TaxID=203523 RepID=UPI0003AB251F|nr:VOC family protein [Longispora albida]